MAKAVGVTPTSVSEWETDKSTPREEALAKLAKFLGVTPAFLRYGIVPGGVPEILRGARRLTEEELDRAEAIVERAKPSAPKAAAEKRGGKSA